jgi:hypothetical protein
MPHGISNEIMNGYFELFDVTPEYYSINVKYVAKNSLATEFIADATYKYKECTGYQSVKQLPPDNSVASLKFGIVSAIRVAFTVNTNLMGCSPEKSNFTTYKYFTDGISSSGENIKFAPLGQDIVGGMYSVVDGTFAIPSGTLKSGGSGKIESLILNDKDYIFKEVSSTTPKPGNKTLTNTNMTLTINGISGLSSGEYFKANGVPEIYNQTGVFQITNIKHNVASDGWNTTIEAGFRIVDK